MSRILAHDFDNDDTNIKYLNKIIKDIKEDRNIIYLAGDNLLYNKKLIKDRTKRFKDFPENGLNKIIEGEILKDITYDINYHMKSENKYLCINTVNKNDTLLNKTKYGYLSTDQEKFLKNNITSDDILILSEGNNDIINSLMNHTDEHYDDIRKNILELLPKDNIDEQLGFLTDMLKTQIEEYIHKILLNYTTPKYIIILSMPYPCNTNNFYGKLYDDLLYIGINNENEVIDKFKKLVNLIYKKITCEINVKNCIVIPVATFEVLDSSSILDKDKQKVEVEERLKSTILEGEMFTDYLTNTVLSTQGSFLLSAKISNLITLYDTKITNDIELNKCINDLALESKELNDNKKLDISIYNGLKLKISNYFKYNDFYFILSLKSLIPLELKIKENVRKLLKDKYKSDIDIIDEYNDGESTDENIRDYFKNFEPKYNRSLFITLFKVDKVPEEFINTSDIVLIKEEIKNNEEYIDDHKNIYRLKSIKRIIHSESLNNYYIRNNKKIIIMNFNISSINFSSDSSSEPKFDLSDLSDSEVDIDNV